MYNCEFCDGEFTTKSNMVYHQKNTKYCLEKQGIKGGKKFECEYCESILSSEKRLKTHYLICDKYTIDKIEKKYKEEIDVLNQNNMKLIEEKDKQIEEQKQQIKDLQDKLENVAIKAVSRPTNTIKNTQNNYIQQLKPVTEDVLNENVQHLTIDHILKGPEGYAEYALEFPLKDRVACIDYSRRKVKFKDQEGNVITDPEMTNLATKFFKSIKDKNKTLILEYGNQLHERLGDNIDTIVQLMEYKIKVDNGADGEKQDFHHDFVKQMCSKTIVD